MPFFAIEGTFHVFRSSPDGDSVKFKARKKARWNKIKNRKDPNKKIEVNSRGEVQIRVEALDALETHYKSNYEQPEKPADDATDRLLDLLGIKNVKWGPTRRFVTSADDGTPGFLLARETGPFGRPISFLFAGNPGLTDGEEVFMDASLMKKSANYAMLKAGQAYPLFYETLFFDLRDELKNVVSAARKANKGIWKIDRSRSGFDASDIDDLQEDVAIWPKLFRRLASMDKDGVPLSKLGNILSHERVTILPAVQHTGLDTAVKINGKNVELLHDPENLVVGTVIR